MRVLATLVCVAIIVAIGWLYLAHERNEDFMNTFGCAFPTSDVERAACREKVLSKLIALHKKELDAGAACKVIEANYEPAYRELRETRSPTTKQVEDLKRLARYRGDLGEIYKKQHRLFTDAGRLATKAGFEFEASILGYNSWLDS